jgi:CheY-like chemotaxis protein
MPQKTVLLVEDDLDIRDSLQDLLEEEGYDVVPASHGKQAIEFLELSRQCRPDVVILDLFMPLVTGSQVLEAMRRDPSLAKIPVIVISATSHTEKPPGAAAFIKKPIALDHLFATVREFARQSA